MLQVYNNKQVGVILNFAAKQMAHTRNHTHTGNINIPNIGESRYGKICAASLW